LLTGADTEDIFALVAVTLPPYDPGVPPHLHFHHSEGCYVLAGTLAVTQGHQTITLAPGAAVKVPAGVRHTYWKPTAAPTTILLIYSPGVTDELAAGLAIGLSGEAAPAWDTS
jgi:quercetin dioxygenase-like cupin family protein